MMLKFYKLLLKIRVTDFPFLFYTLYFPSSLKWAGEALRGLTRRAQAQVAISDQKLLVGLYPLVTGRRFHHWGSCSVCARRSVVSDSLRPHGLQPARLLSPWTFLGKNTGVGCHFPPQGIFPTQGSNLRCLQLLDWQARSLQLSHQGSPCVGYVRRKAYLSIIWNSNLTGHSVFFLTTQGQL